MSDGEYQEFPTTIFEDKPLYSKVEWPAEKVLYHTKVPAVHLYCGNCARDRTFNSVGSHGTVGPRGDLAGETIAIWYRCAYCSASKYSFLLRVSEDRRTLMKVGQYPPPEINVGRHLARILREHEALYKKGLICEQFGYGIAAHAYYRRILELIIDRLLAIVPEVLSAEDGDAYATALKSVQNSHNAAEKILIVKELLPLSLRPDGLNPLDIVYEALSEGLHRSSDEDCLSIATQVRSAITYIVDKIESEGQITREFTHSMRVLLERKRPKPA